VSRAAPQGALRDPSFVVSLVIAVVVALGFGLVVPVLPLFARDFGVGLFAVTLVVSVFAGVRFFSNIYTGALSDRIGRRRAIGWGAIIVAVSSLLTALAPGYWYLLLFRGMGGFGSALFFNALLSLVIVIVPAEVRGRAVGLLQGAFLLGISIGPLVGGFLAEPLGLRWPFAIYAFFCGAAGVVALVFLPRRDEMPVRHVEGARGPDEEPLVAASETARAKGIGAMWRTARELCLDKAFLAALVMMAASRWAATGVRFSLVPVFGAEEVGASVLVVSVSLTVAAATHALMLWPAGTVADRFGRKVIGAPAYLLFAVIVATFTLAGTVPAFLVAMGLYGIGTGLTSVTPPAVVGDVVDPERTGVAIGVLNTAGDLGSVLGPLVSGYLAEHLGYGWGFGAAAAFLAIGGVYAMRMRETLPAAASS
jgi:MFS transporter, DHA1 family, multidrug resistance protein